MTTCPAKQKKSPYIGLSKKSSKMKNQKVVCGPEAQMWLDLEGVVSLQFSYTYCTGCVRLS